MEFDVGDSSLEPKAQEKNTEDATSDRERAEARDRAHNDVE